MRGCVLSILFVLGGCASWDFTTARSVTVKPGKGGTLTLNPPQDPRARAKAQDIMQQTCGSKKAEITEEGDAVVGTKTSANTEHRRDGGGGVKVAGLSFGAVNPSSNTESEQKNITEWRITYECK